MWIMNLHTIQMTVNTKGTMGLWLNGLEYNALLGRFDGLLTLKTTAAAAGLHGMGERRAKIAQINTTLTLTTLLNNYELQSRYVYYSKFKTFH